MAVPSWCATSTANGREVRRRVRAQWSTGNEESEARAMAGKWQEGKNLRLQQESNLSVFLPRIPHVSEGNRSSSSRPSMTESIKTLVMPTSRRPPLLLAYRFLFHLVTTWKKGSVYLIVPLGRVFSAGAPRSASGIRIFPAPAGSLISVRLPTAHVHPPLLNGCSLSSSQLLSLTFGCLSATLSSARAHTLCTPRISNRAHGQNPRSQPGHHEY